MTKSYLKYFSLKDIDKRIKDLECEIDIYIWELDIRGRTKRTQEDVNRYLHELNGLCAERKNRNALREKESWLADDFMKDYIENM